MDPEDAARLQAMIADSLQTLAPTSWTGRVIQPSGAIRWIETYTSYTRDADGTVVTCGQATDVTERKETEYLHRAVIDALPAGIIAMTPDGKFPVYNRVANDYVGRAQEDHGGELTRTFGVFKTDGVTQFADEDLPSCAPSRAKRRPRRR